MHCPRPWDMFSECTVTVRVFPWREANSLHLQKQSKIHSPPTGRSLCLVAMWPPDTLPSSKDIPFSQLPCVCSPDPGL